MQALFNQKPFNDMLLFVCKGTTTSSHFFLNFHWFVGEAELFVL